MAKQWKKVAACVLVAAMAVPTVAALAACKDDVVIKPGYRTYTSVMPSNWNELTYADNNDTQILYQIVSSFFEFDYEFDESKGGKYNADGTINVDAIVPGGFTVNYSAATALEDVTSTVDAKWGYTDEQKATGGYAWKITLREDLKWDDGTPIDATDFVYTMDQQLDPLFRNMRASTYYNNIQVKGARNRAYSGFTGWTEARGSRITYTEDLDPVLVFTLGNSTENKEAYEGATVNLRTVWGVPDSYTGADLAATMVASGVAGVTAEQILALEGKTLAEIKADAAMKATWDAIIGWWQTEPNEELDFFVNEYTYPEFSFEDVGYYSPSKYELVVCMDSPIQLKKEDGSLSYEAAYSFQSFPLVKKDLYEECKQEPVSGSELWTTNYNTSLETSASWGPYKLTQFQSGKSYTLERNDNWFGYALEDNKGQYEIDRIECEQISDINTAWMSFLSGNLDSIGLDVTHKEDYRDSKYTYFAPGTGSFGMNLYANLDVLKENGRNNGILAIRDFRKAISLSLDRDDYNATCYTAHQTLLGLLGPAYYYDVENGGVYRDTVYAKEALLRVYGFTENEDGSWTDGTNTYTDYQEAYDAMNGYNPTLAKEFVESAYAELTANADYYGYDASKSITIVFGTNTDNENTRRQYDYFVNMFNEMVEGTPLEGKIELNFDASFGDAWADDFKSGAYEIAAGTGFTGGAFDPSGFLQCYLDPDAGLMYSVWWDTANEQFTFTMPEGDYAGAGEELTMSVYNWYCCLNGLAEAYSQPNTYNWGAGFIPEEARLELTAALEELTLEQYYTIATTSEYNAEVTGAKWSYLTDEYNIFMGFGGYRYMIRNYSDEEWVTYVKDQGGDLSTEYKKTN